MSVLYQSTRDKSNQKTASQAILQGLAADGGLYVPVEFPSIDLDFERLKNSSYQEIATLILHAFFDDFSREEIEKMVDLAYGEKFDTKKIAPVKQVGNHFVLELFHGETIAFKDMALSILPHLMTASADKNAVSNEIVILTATSGDTGKAAMAGFADVPHTKIIVFYPKHGVSEIQERQMLTQKGKNVHVVGIEGNFDQAQTAVKTMFNDTDLHQKMLTAGKQFSSANSMNIGRLIPQVAYYVYAYAQLVSTGSIVSGQKINFSVPTGNFGNILAAYYAKKIGLPINRLICASNKNNVLTDFFKTGHYDKNREFYVTSSPSMDILVSSNLERLIFDLTNKSDEKTNHLLTALQTEGQYQITEEMREKLSDFVADWASEEQISKEIHQTFTDENYVLDPHTAVASHVYRQYTDKTPTIVVSTASPYKFPRVVVDALTESLSVDANDFELVKTLEKISRIPLPKAVKELEAAKGLHNTVVEVTQMQAEVERYLSLK
ncbi:threonine synthase [Lactococcus allomyrinae]|uniref:Threonine synthase n=1 Tax=Lactococcus allomyrinae TaxID=2419773 RepID=A0A387BGC8_9LACT|nr:threonine synthase [Lactococcus allomyrinae]AYG01192.1 threonine synthase [Lactococcus allomyrinae]